ncbi:DNA topoisomerase [Leptospira interrogans serovar Pyrogenes str. L0374]|uniref:DNA topoisomerase n=1 Tax=Leptospira interrogans serovar Pyrogenes str. L0374 TaxID=1049928 RepID=M6KYB3_LEPIR|nr:DNA topoisomerase [Leptospira interrogans serovar Pyrogenes str. L0374]
MVDAQKTRRIGDRLIGYFISPVLWKQIGPGLSAGRVQSVALKWICEREEEIRNFKIEIYYNILLHGTDQKGIVGIFSRTGDRIFSKEKADQILQNVQKEKELRISEKKETLGKLFPPPPFQTASLQQEAFKKLRFSSKKTMSLSQRLYEGMDLGNGQRNGLITYMRTDSVRLSSEFVERARSWILSELGETFASPLERKIRKSAKKIQDAHEAIRVTDPFLTPKEIKKFLGKEEAALYDLIWKRTISSLLPAEEFIKIEYSIFAARECFQLETKKTIFPGYKILNEADVKTNPSWEKGELFILQKVECEKNKRNRRLDIQKVL